MPCAQSVASTPGAPWQYTQLSRYCAKPRRTCSSVMLAGAAVPRAWRCTEFFIVVLNTQVSTDEWGTEAATLNPPVNTTARPTMASTRIAKAKPSTKRFIAAIRRQTRKCGRRSDAHLPTQLSTTSAGFWWSESPVAGRTAGQVGDDEA